MLTLSRSLFVVATTLLVSCSDGGGGDALAPFKGSILGGGEKLSSLNNRLNPDGSENPPPNANAIVPVTGVRVTWVDQYDETHDGKSVGNIFLQDFTDPAGPYEGIIAFQSSYSPPSFRTSVGDVIDISGQYQEFQLSAAATDDRIGWTTPEFSGGKITLRFDAPYIPIVPVEIPLSDLITYSTGRQWLSMVVTLKGVTFSGDVANPSNTRATIDLNAGAGLKHLPQVSNSLFDLAGYVAQIKSDRNLTTIKGVTADVTGIVTQTFGFQISPRSAEDIVIH